MDFADLAHLEKESREHPERAEQHSDTILALLPHDHWVVRMLVARLLPRLRLTDQERCEALEFLFEQASGKNRFVAAWALDSLALFAAEDPSLRHEVVPLLEAALFSSPAVRGRAQKALARLDGNA